MKKFGNDPNERTVEVLEEPDAKKTLAAAAKEQRLEEEEKEENDKD